MPANDPHAKPAGGAQPSASGHQGEAHGSGSHGSSGPPHREEEHHEGAPEWLISFADNVTLMMGFFVVMLSMSMAAAAAGGHGGNPKSHERSQGATEAAQAVSVSPRMLDLMISIREGFNNPVNASTPAPGDEAMAERLKQLLAGSAQDAGVAGDKQVVQSLRDTDYHALSGFVLFEARSTELTAQAKADLKRFASMTKGLRLIIDIRAHTSAAEAFGQNDHGIRFSLDRGLAVAQYLTSQGLDWKQLRIIPQGDTDPIQTRAYDAPSHGQNDCVEFRVSNELMKQ